MADWTRSNAVLASVAVDALTLPSDLLATLVFSSANRIRLIADIGDNFRVDSITTDAAAAASEPATLLPVGLGLLALAVRRWLWKRSSLTFLRLLVACGF